MTPPTPHEALVSFLAGHKVLKLATAGGPVSPWLTGAYFVEDGAFALHLILEKTGKGMKNILADPRVAVAIDDATPFTLFAQAEGRASLVEGAEAARRLAALRSKVPEIEPLLMGPVNVLRIDVPRWLVTSFEHGWFPAREVRP